MIFPDKKAFYGHDLIQFHKHIHSLLKMSNYNTNNAKAQKGFKEILYRLKVCGKSL